MDGSGERPDTAALVYQVVDGTLLTSLLQIPELYEEWTSERTLIDRQSEAVSVQPVGRESRWGT